MFKVRGKLFSFHGKYLLIDVVGNRVVTSKKRSCPLHIVMNKKQIVQAIAFGIDTFLVTVYQTLITPS
ncbi:hypothetical protein Ccrd_003009 [Cynara cardunculus var. scolymus]|uniref:Uncharacterized protein n=1 Tax=Cynara cardunculus var. scolymus TaxID=59895 RepID=A0A103XQA7_CYNCS|nr:hypothetical protein Ccrd_003009 [Cynara cardunculus var. scolymus]